MKKIKKMKKHNFNVARFFIVGLLMLGQILLSSQPQEKAAMSKFDSQLNSMPSVATARAVALIISHLISKDREKNFAAKHAQSASYDDVQHAFFRNHL